MSDKIKEIRDNPFKAMLILSIPIIILLIFNETYSMIDTYFISTLGKTVIVAFGYIAQFYYFLNRTGKGIGRGVSSMVTRLIGAEKYENINNIALHGCIIIIILTLLLQLIFLLFSDIILKLIVPESSILPTHIYLQCLFTFLIFVLSSEYFVELLNSEGETRLSTRIMILGVFLNISFDYIFIVLIKLGILGASLGTVVSYIITTIIFLYIYIIRKSHIIKFKKSAFKFDVSIIVEILKNAIPIILDSLMTTIAGILVLTALKQFAPPSTLIAFVLILRVQMLLFTPISGLSRACNIIVGYLFGAKRYKDVLKQMHNSILVSFLINILISVIIILFLKIIIGLFTKDPIVLRETQKIFYVILIDLITFSVIHNGNQGLIAIGYSSHSFYSVIVRIVSLLALTGILAYLCKFGEIGVFSSLLLSDIIQGTYSYFRFKHFVLKEEKKSNTT